MNFFKARFNPFLRHAFPNIKRILSTGLAFGMLLTGWPTLTSAQDKKDSAGNAAAASSQNGQQPTVSKSDSASTSSGSAASQPAADSKKSDDKAGDKKGGDAKDDKTGKKGEAALKYPLPDLKPLGAAGPKTVHDKDDEISEEFIPMPDRWRFGWPRFKRYNGSIANNLPFVEGNPFDPFNQNEGKGDYPIFGNKYFLNLNFQSNTTFNPREEATAKGPVQQVFVNQNFVAGVEIFRGDTVFEPKVWSAKVTGVFNLNGLANGSLGLGDIKQGKSRVTAEEAFFEKRLKVLSVNYDIISLRVGMQNFNSDFRGFLFVDNQLGVRLFGNLHSNRDQYNLAYFTMRQRDSTSQLHSFEPRHQDVFIANWYRQDFITKGYTAMANFHFNNDRGLVVGDQFQLHAAYVGFHGDGHWGDWNVDHAFYQAFGSDDHNRVTGKHESINAQMAAFEISRDVNWWRYRFSVFYASGDGNINDGKAHGFDMIQDNPEFAGGQFMYWDQQQKAVPILGILGNKFSLDPDLRDKFVNRANFVNPGVFFVNGGTDVRITPKLKLSPNLSYLRFASTGALRQLTGIPNLSNGIGWDLSVGAKYRPFLNENFFFLTGYGALFTQGGMRTLLGSGKTLQTAFVAIQFVY
ncbi:MAG TPA: hypothetical protein VFC63_01110 [Blastocatellia bacterium]|nr:hypothetical protein [Blastocatellia bacterium]